MSLLTSDELAQLRTDLAALLPDTCIILSSTYTPDGVGGQTQTWGTAAASAACRVDPYQRQDSAGIVAEREAARTWYRLTVEYNAALAYDCRVVFDGDTYEVVQLYDDHSLRAVRRATIAKIEGGA